jgi:hypothetical protein
MGRVLQTEIVGLLSRVWLMSFEKGVRRCKEVIGRSGVEEGLNESSTLDWLVFNMGQSVSFDSKME